MYNRRAIQAAKLQAQRTWKDWGERQIRRRRRVQQRLATTGTYESYDADRGLYQIRTDRGIIELSSITNAGLQPGDRVVINPEAKTFKSMPRG